MASERFRCSACGVKANCECAAPYISASEYVKQQEAKRPELREMSNKAVGLALGVSDMTVKRVRDFTQKSRGSRATNVAPEKTLGKDGKKYPARKPKKLTVFSDAGSPQMRHSGIGMLHSTMRRCAADMKEFVENYDLQAFDELERELMQDGISKLKTGIHLIETGLNKNKKNTNLKLVKGE